MAHAGESGALSWKLRAATDLVRLRQAPPGAARAILQPVLAAFTEGFTTRDYLAALELIDATAQRQSTDRTVHRSG